MVSGAIHDLSATDAHAPMYHCSSNPAPSGGSDMCSHHDTTLQFSSVIVRVGNGLSHGDSDMHRTKPCRIQSPLQCAVADGTQRSRSNDNMTLSLASFPQCGIQLTLSHAGHMHVDGLRGERPHQTSLGSSDDMVVGKREGFDVV